MASIQISEFQPPDVHLDGSTAKLRIYCDGDWTDSLGVPHLSSPINSKTGFFQEIDLTITGTVLTIPAFTTYSTLDARQNSAVKFTGIIFDEADTPQHTLFENWFIPISPTTTTWDALQIINQGQQLIWPPSTYLNAVGVQQLIDAVIGVLRFATSVLAGWVRLSVPAANTADPIAVGDNDPRVIQYWKVASNGTEFNAAVAAIGSTAGVIVITGDCITPVNQTFPATLAFVFLPGGSIHIQTNLPPGTVTTILGPVIAPPNQQIFKGRVDESFTGNTNIVGAPSAWFNSATLAAAAIASVSGAYVINSSGGLETQTKGADLTISGNAIAPTNAVHKVGAGLIKNITVPAGFASGVLYVIPTAAFTTDTSGNIGLASLAVIGKVMMFTFDGTKWWPSY